MRLQTFTLLFCFAAAALPASGKQKQPVLLPPWLLEAHTVAVIVDPQAGVALEDPNANQVPQRDVEAALTNWGRLQPVLSTENADLLIVIRRGHDRLAEPTITDPRQNRRPGSVTTSDSGIGVGVQHGTPPFDSSGANRDPQATSPHTQTEIGGAEDLFAVYRGYAAGDDRRPLDSAPAWHVLQKNALKPHSVPAVEQFRKAVNDAERAAATAQKQHP